MKPLKLVIQGIRSFTEKAEIDFNKVSKNGLFGIFGSTGSGKSTILDSIIIALYGEIRKQNMAEIINVRCKNAYVGLDFEILENDVRRSFFVERSFKLKKDGSYGGAVASLYETTGGVRVVLASQTNDVNKRIEEIIGLGQNEFTKCIILPQGEFSQFVKATKGDRVKIIEKLFSLERFGDNFSIKIRNKLSQLNMQIALTLEDLKHYEDATVEALNLARENEQITQNECDLLNVKLLKIKEYIDKNQYYYNLCKQVEADSEALSKLSCKQEEINDKKVKASLYEKAKIIDDASNVFLDLTSKKLASEALLASIQASLDNENMEYQKACAEYEALPTIIENHQALTNKREELLSARGDVDKYNDLKSKIKSIDAKIEEQRLNLDKHLLKISELSAFENEISGRLKEIEKSININEVFSFITDSALKEEFEEQLDYYKSHKQDIDAFSNCGELYSFVDSKCIAKIKEYTSKLEEVQASKGGSLEDAVENYKKAIDLKGEIEGQLNSLMLEKVRVEESVKSLRLDIKKQVEENKNYVEELNLLNVKLLKIVDNIEDYENNIDTVTKKLKDCIERVEEIRKSYNESKERLSEIKLNLQSASLALGVANDDYLKQEKALNALLCEDISTVDIAKDILSVAVDVKFLNDEITAFEKDFDFYTKSIARMQAEIKNADFNSEEYSKTMLEKDVIEKNHEIFKEKLINCKNITQKLSQNFDKRCIIEKDLNILRARASVFERLEQAVSRRAFSEFVSAEFLSDVARSARKILLDLTSGKYDVVYKDSFDGGKDGFYILDNMNGGAERSVASLSGGETFLVSLSLALSLSASIYASSNRPMEFFFLDEGFGTLDENLVDTVLDSLEKLRNKSFSIGLISHLAEMKSRIDCKIMVTSADETHGSRVIHLGIS